MLLCCFFMAMATTAPSVADSAAKKNLEKEHFNIQNVRGSICLIFRKQQCKRWDRVENVPVLQLWYSVGHLSIKLFFLKTLKETLFFFQTMQLWFHGFVPETVSQLPSTRHTWLSEACQARGLLVLTVTKASLRAKGLDEVPGTQPVTWSYTWPAGGACHSHR